MHFNCWKWEGTGNDFVLFDRRDWPELPDAGEIHRLCDRDGPVGADGVIFFRPMVELRAERMATDWEMDYINADGSRSFCGNGSRALFSFLREKGWMPQKGGILHACDGAHAVCWNAALGEPGVEIRSVAPPRVVPSFLEGDRAHFVNTGSPHHIEWVDEVRQLDVIQHGRAIRNASEYAPDGTNVDFVRVAGDGSLEMRTFERGVENETKACGTGAAAAAIADYSERGGSLERRMAMSGGRLTVQVQPPDAKTGQFDGVWLFGAARQEMEGIWDAAKGRLIAAMVAMLAISAVSAPVNTIKAAPWTDQVRVSVLTGSPGPELYSAWGHTAIRVLDMGQVPPVDLTYNYGTFEFSEGFYLRFLKGELNYRLARSSFSAFQREYMREGRAVLEQPLALEPDDARALVAYLEWNHLPENRVYAYKFFEDNCSSRVLYLLNAVFGERWDSGCAGDVASGVTYRQAIRPYIVGDAWTEAGIDFILGPHADEVMPPCGSSFLPDGLMVQLLQGSLDGRTVAQQPSELLPPERSWYRGVASNPISSPRFWSWMLLLWSFIWSIRRLVQHRAGVAVPRWERRLGKGVQLLAGTLGVLLALMWMFTDHTDTWANWNLIWASPALILLIRRGGRLKPWQDRTRWGLSVVILLFLLALPFVPQFVSFLCALVAWSVWLSLDPWDVPGGWPMRTKK